MTEKTYFLDVLDALELGRWYRALLASKVCGESTA